MLGLFRFLIKFLSGLIILLSVLGIAGFGLMAFGKMPVSLYDRAFAAYAELLPGSGPFDGIWQISATSSIDETDEAFCGKAEGQLFAKDNRINGSVVNEFGDTFRIMAKLDNGGEITGGMAQGTENTVKFTGLLLDSDGEAKWNDILGCYGTASFQRTYAAGSYETRYIKYLDGRAFVIRGVHTYPAKSGFPLRSGDIVAVEDNSFVQINLGQNELDISENTKFEIPNDPTPLSPPTFLDRGWNAVKTLIQGEDYKIPTPTAVAGVRG